MKYPLTRKQRQKLSNILDKIECSLIDYLILKNCPECYEYKGDRIELIEMSREYLARLKLRRILTRIKDSISYSGFAKEKTLNKEARE